MENKLLFIDTETGGIDEKKHSLLSVGLIYWENLEIKDTLEIYIKEDRYEVTDEALKINGLDLKKVYSEGVNYKEAVQKINEFIKRNFKNEKPVICGHNINFDIRFLKELYKKANFDYENYISYRSLDTASILKFLTLADKFNGKKINSLDDAIKYFELKTNKRHTALEDIKLTVKIFNRLLKIIV